MISQCDRRIKFNNPKLVMNLSSLYKPNYHPVFIKKDASFSSDINAINNSADMTAHMSQFSTYSPRQKIETPRQRFDLTQLLSERGNQTNLNRSLDWERKSQLSQLPQPRPDILQQNLKLRLSLVTKNKKPETNPYKIVKILHGVQADQLINRVRWDENKLIKEYFGSSLKNPKSQVNNINPKTERLPKFLPRQLQTRMNPKTSGISSVLEINPDQFESSLRSCSRRLKAEKYQYLQKFLSADKWEQLFGKTDMMKQREVKKRRWVQRQEQFLIKVRDTIKQKESSPQESLENSFLFQSSNVLDRHSSLGGKGI